MSTQPPASVGGLSAADLWGEDPEAQALEGQIGEMDTQQLQSRVRMFDNNIRVMKSEVNRLDHEVKSKQAQIKENNEKVRQPHAPRAAPADQHPPLSLCSHSPSLSPFRPSRSR